MDAYRKQQQARNEAKRQKQQEELQEKLAAHVSSFPIKLLFPARIFSSRSSNSDGDQSSSSSSSSSAPPPPLRTSPDYINFRLQETGLDFSTLENERDEQLAAETFEYYKVQEYLQTFVQELEDTGCYDKVQVLLGRKNTTDKQKGEGDANSNSNSNSNSSSLRQVDVILQEKNWYKLYVGGGVKSDASNLSSGSANLSAGGLLPKVQFESSASLLNVTGHCDTTHLSYTVDQTSVPTLSAVHTRPLYTCFDPDTNPLWETILSMDRGCNIGLSLRGQIETVDYEHVRSCKDHLQTIGVRIANGMKNASVGPDGPPTGEGSYLGLDWSLSHRDVMPRRHVSIPYLCDASPEVLTSSGPSLKHSIVGEYRSNGYYLDSRFDPTVGLDWYGGVEVAGPPGTVGFWKLWGGGSFHLPLFYTLGNDGEEERLEAGAVGKMLGDVSIHGIFHGGLIKRLSFGGLLSDDDGGVTNIADRFYVGGPMQLRGFLPAGIGPRAETGGSSTTGGDSLGGDAFYTATTAISFPFPGISTRTRARLFGFANTGALAGLPNDLGDVRRFWRSSRVAVGGGLSVGTPMGRVEATYAVPLRYGPRDGRKSFQVGLGMNFG